MSRGHGFSLYMDDSSQNPPPLVARYVPLDYISMRFSEDQKAHNIEIPALNIMGGTYMTSDGHKNL